MTVSGMFSSDGKTPSSIRCCLYHSRSAGSAEKALRLTLILVANACCRLAGLPRSTAVTFFVQARCKPVQGAREACAILYLLSERLPKQLQQQRPLTQSLCECSNLLVLWRTIARRALSGSWLISIWVASGPAISST